MVLQSPFLNRVKRVLISGSSTGISEHVISNTSQLTIRKMLMPQWMECMCDADYGSIKNDMVLWMELVSEYQELRGDSIEAIEVLRLSKEIHRLYHHLYLFQVCVEELGKRYSESLAQSLRDLGYPFNPVIKEPSEYINLLENCINRSKTKYVQLQQVIKQLEVAKPTGKPPSREYYEETLLNVEQYQKVSYNMDNITVYKFCLLEKRLRNYALKQQQHRK